MVANDQRTLFSNVPITVFPMLIVKILVNVEAGVTNPVGIKVALPMTIWTANASPKARAIPKTTAVSRPGVAARNTTL